MKYLLKSLTIACVLGVLMFASSTSFAQRAPSGFGIGVGAATVASGLSIKTSTGSGYSFQGVIGTWRGWGRHWRFGGDSLAVAGDFLIEMPALASGQIVSLGWNYGLGAGVGLSPRGTAIIGGSGVLGLEFNFVPAPIDLVIEYRPGLYIGDNYGGIALLDATAHLRFWF
jgi:hypothetical protein